MAVTDDIFRSWRGPRAVIRQQLPGITEARVLSYLLMAVIMIILAQAPWLSRQAHLDPSIPFAPRMLAAALGILAVLPVVAYLLAAGSHLIARAFGGQGSWLGARLALFWTFLAMAPLFLLNGLVAGFIGQGPQLTLVSIILVVCFFVHWFFALVEAETGNK